MNTDPNNLRLTTGRLFWLPTGDTGWIDLGNCTSHKPSPEVTRAPHWKYSGGVKRVDHSVVVSFQNKRVFTFDEHFEETIKLQNFAARKVIVTQTAQTGLTRQTIMPPAGYGTQVWLGYYNITPTSVVTTPGGVAVVEGQSYLLNRATGIVTLIALSTSAEDTWNWTFNCAAISGAFDQVQAAATGLTINVASASLALARSYDTGRQMISSLTGVTAGATPLVEDVDYSVDLATGFIRILSSTNFGSNWIFTFNCALVSTLDFSSFSKLLSTGTFKFVESDQFDAVPAGTDTLSGTVYVTGWGETAADKFQEFTVEVISLA